MARAIKTTHGDVELCWQVSILEHDVRIHAVTICGRDIFNIIDPEIRRAAYVDFKHRYISTTA